MKREWKVVDLSLIGQMGSIPIDILSFWPVWLNFWKVRYESNNTEAALATCLNHSICLRADGLLNVVFQFNRDSTVLGN